MLLSPPEVLEPHVNTAPLLFTAAKAAALAARLTREHLATSHDYILSYLLEHPGAAGGDDVVNYHDRGNQEPAPTAKKPRGAQVKGTQS